MADDQQPVKKKRLKAPDVEQGGSDPFVVQFTALTMILLAFFILLNSMASPDQRRTKMAIGSLMGSFGILPDGTGLMNEGLDAPSGNIIMSGIKKETFLSSLGSMFRGATATGKMKIMTDRTRVVLAFDSDFLFPSGVSEVNPAAFPYLDEIGHAMQILRTPVRIEGHTDSTPGKSPMDNWRISAQRAISVLRYLRDGCHVDAKLLSAVGYADTRPAGGKAKATGPEHRRVEIIMDGLMEVTGGK